MQRAEDLFILLNIFIELAVTLGGKLHKLVCLFTTSIAFRPGADWHSHPSRSNSSRALISFGASGRSVATSQVRMCFVSGRFESSRPIWPQHPSFKLEILYPSSSQSRSSVHIALTNPSASTCHPSGQTPSSFPSHPPAIIPTASNNPAEAGKYGVGTLVPPTGMPT